MPLLVSCIQLKYHFANRRWTYSIRQSALPRDFPKEILLQSSLILILFFFFQRLQALRTKVEIGARFFCDHWLRFGE